MNQFTERLLQWNKSANTRSMPWKGEKDPYKIWLSEIILQQTRVEQGRKYYQAFVDSYPSIQQLAAAKDEAVFKLWEGLGYYSRCRNLINTARVIVQKYNGKFPAHYSDMLKLKGIGPYTAAAIASFAYNLPYAVLDGNVFRVLSRIYGIQTPIDTNAGKKQFQELAVKNLGTANPALYNQAIMDFGATVCKPSPICSDCPMRDICTAFKRNLISHLPVREKKTKKRDRFFTQFIIIYQDEVLVNKRTAKDVWRDLYEFYAEESDKPVKWSAETIRRFFADRFQIDSIDPIIFAGKYKQVLTHQNIYTTFVMISIVEKTELLKSFHWTKMRFVRFLAFPKTAKTFMDETDIFDRPM